MLLNEIFAKDVQRPIEGVIKADDVAHLGTEVEEYVLTNEAAKGLELLLEAYTNYTNANGVWISGFFGSGKSHLLKMLAHLLGDVEGQDFDRARGLGELPRQGHRRLPARPARRRPSASRPRACCSTSTRRPRSSPRTRPTPCSRCSSRSSTRAAATTATRATSPASSATSTTAASTRRSRRPSSASPASRGPRAASRAPSRAPSIDRAFAEVNGEADRRHHQAVPGVLRGLHRGLRRRGQGVARQAARRLPPQLLRRRGRPVHRLQHPPDAQPPDHRREPQHQVRAAARGCS